MKSVLLLILTLSINVAWGCEGSLQHQQQTQQQLGIMVQSIANAIDSPSLTSVETLVRYGTDSRYYVMIRGWIVQELTGVESQLAAQGDNADPMLVNKAKHLKISLRRIDLE